LTVQVHQEAKVIKIISTGNSELDLRLGGGLPFPSFILIEGDHGSGKSVLMTQFVYGALKEGLRTTICTTESLIRDFIKQAKQLSFDVTRFFLRGRLKVIPIHMEGLTWDEEVAKMLVPVLSAYMEVTKDEYDVFTVDGFSVISVYADTSSILDFLTRLKTLVGEGKLIILTMHPGGLPEEAALRMRSICDAFFKLSIRTVGGKAVKVMEVVKLRGADSAIDSTVVFDVEPAFGIKIIPLGLAKT